MKVIDIADTIAPNCKKVCIGIRPGKKYMSKWLVMKTHYLPLSMSYYKILPQINDWSKDKARIKKG